MKPSFASLIVLLSIVAFPASQSHAGIVQELDWDSTSGLLGVTSNGQVAGLTAATSIDGVTGVLTSSDLTGNDPQLGLLSTALNGVVLPAGFTSWDTIEIRLRHLDGNPGVASVAPRTFSTNGDFIQFLVNGTRVNPAETFTTEATGEWVLASYDISGVDVSSTIGIGRYDPIGNFAAGNFEIDYIRFNGVASAVAIPEPASRAVLGVTGLGLALLRRRRKAVCAS